MDDNRIQGAQTDPQLFDVLYRLRRDIFASLNVCQIGKIETYDPLTNSASVSIQFKRLLPDNSEIDYPLLLQVPVVILNGGGASLTFPITAGDQCLIIFNDRNIDNWYLEGAVRIPSDARMHNLSDGFALIGARNLSTAQPSPINSVCLNGGSKKVAIKNAATTLKTILDSLMDCLTSLKVIDTGTPSVPAGTWAIDPTTLATLGTIKSSIATLLDEGIT